MPINVKMATNVGIFTVMSRIHFMLIRIEHDKSFITSRSGPEVIKLFFQKLNSAKHEIYPAHKCLNANNC